MPAPEPVMETSMINNFEDDEEFYVWLKIHDPKRNKNWTAELYGTADELRRLGPKSARLMDDAGFLVGWRPGAKYCGSIDYLILVREAVERRWWASFRAKWWRPFRVVWPMSFKMV